MLSKPGFTIIEVLIITFVIGTIATGVFGLFALNLRTVNEAERRVVGLALANERAERIRNLSYKDVGTVGGVPPGSLPPLETVTRNGLTFTVKTDIRYIDDVFDGTATGSPADTLNTDYKQARVEVSWAGPTIAKPIVLLLTVAPAGIEGGDALGTLIFSAINATGQGVSDVTVTLQNSTVSPVIAITTETDNNGQVVLPGLPIASGSYTLAISRPGYTSEQTYSASPSFIPDADHSHLSTLAGQITSKTFLTDVVSQLAVITQNEAGAALGNIPYTLSGTKTIGSTNQGERVFQVNQTATTASNGTNNHPNLLWDAYTVTVDGIATGYDIKKTSAFLPLTVAPNQEATLTVMLTPHNDQSLLVSVIGSNAVPVAAAAVRLFGAGYDVTLTTGTEGQVYFPDSSLLPLPAAGEYTVEVAATGFENFSQTVTVAGTTRLPIQLTPTVP